MQGRIVRRCDGRLEAMRRPPARPERGESGGNTARAAMTNQAAWASRLSTSSA
jgi:hypothetical protein